MTEGQADKLVLLPAQRAREAYIEKVTEEFCQHMAQGKIGWPTPEVRAAIKLGLTTALSGFQILPNGFQ